MIINNQKVGLDQPLLLIAGPCVIESRDFILDTASKIKEIVEEFPVNFVFKASFDKANRTSIHSFRGLGLDEGLSILGAVKEQLGVPVLTDIHTPEQAGVVAEVVDVLQTPAFLCRQTDFIQAAVATGKPVNIKKGQFLSPYEMKHVATKAIEAGGKDKIMLCERGASFGYNNLVVDMRSLAIMRESKCPVIFDATHSVQQPGSAGASSGGHREFVPFLARAAVAAGVSGIFAEVHPDPDNALSDGPNALPLNELKAFVGQLVAIRQTLAAAPRTSFDNIFGHKE